MMRVKQKVFYLILEEKQKLKRIDLALQPDLLSEEEIVVWNSILEELKKEIPFSIGFNELLWFGF
jgi:release factor glutamine methyltransferase